MQTKQEGKAENNFPLGTWVVVFEHGASFFDFSNALSNYVYHFQDERLNDPKEWDNLINYFGIFTENMEKAIKSKKPLLLMRYNPVIAFCLKTAIDNFQQEKQIRFSCLSFFHNDEITSDIHIDYESEERIELMDIKWKIIETMLDFPFIKKMKYQSVLK
ncbi:MAG: hypothetical protein LBC52_00635 [Treponema sp.]|jgi:hypothetical protein|nr:hypothetical protein [Treponema sp.]